MSRKRTCNCSVCEEHKVYKRLFDGKCTPEQKEFIETQMEKLMHAESDRDWDGMDKKILMEKFDINLDQLQIIRMDYHDNLKS